MNGYVYAGAHDARNHNPPFPDTNGIRVMGDCDRSALNYYYMASQFATSERWFAPVMTGTQSNRDYRMAATSEEYVYPIGTDSHDQKLLTAKPIFEALQSASITWKIYVNPENTPCASNPTPVSARIQLHSEFSVGTFHPTEPFQASGADLAILHRC